MSEDSHHSGKPLRVVFVDEEDGTYRVDDEALRRVCGHEAARALPVAVVSVAGATRGGKSFLLDFFLRYLRASDEARRSGAWLGADDQPLTGFSWRGGCDRHTDGIVIWSEPIIVPLGSHESSDKVAVVLMDTQGAFDSSSTVRDSSIIFAMSALLSSVLVYNLSQNINEDDLQYLQLFTEYGRLAQEQSLASPFQVLQVLVRDWSYAYEYPVGAHGGMELLDKRLQIREEQAAELRELRTHLRSVFAALRCWLLPHPGLTVATSPAFRGCLQDISSDFKDGLIDFIPSLFDPQHITVKTMLGRPITVQDLPYYFKNYIEIFNSDSLPSPVTVTKALGMASLEATYQAARRAYTEYMERGCKQRVAPRAVPILHQAALTIARDTFTNRKTLASTEMFGEKLRTLLADLNEMLANYIALNRAKTLEAIANSKAIFEKFMQMEKCLLPTEVEDLHGKAKEKAIKHFTDSRASHCESDIEDDEDFDNRKALEEELDGLLPLYRERNLKRIESVSSECRGSLEARIRKVVDSVRCLHSQSLLKAHRDTKAKVLKDFDDFWNEGSAMNEHRDALDRDMETIYERFVEENNNNNSDVAEEVAGHYSTTIEGLFEGDKCLHPLDLARSHQRALNAAREEFHTHRDAKSRIYPADEYLNNLNRELYRRYHRYESRNEDLNSTAIERAHDTYYRIMYPTPAPGLVEGFLNPFGAFDFSRIQRHGVAKEDAILMFKTVLRLEGPDHDEDRHLQKLIEKIDWSWATMLAEMVARIGVQAANLMFMTGYFLRR